MNRPQSTYQYEHDSCYDPLYDKKEWYKGGKTKRVNMWSA